MIIDRTKSKQTLLKNLVDVAAAMVMMQGILWKWTNYLSGMSEIKNLMNAVSSLVNKAPGRVSVYFV